MSIDKKQSKSSLSKALEEHLSTVFTKPVAEKTQEFNALSSDKRKEQHSQKTQPSAGFDHEFNEKLKMSFGAKIEPAEDVKKTHQEILMSQALEDNRIQQLKIDQEKAYKEKLILVEEKIKKAFEKLEAKKRKGSTDNKINAARELKEAQVKKQIEKQEIEKYKQEIYAEMAKEKEALRLKLVKEEIGKKRLKNHVNKLESLVKQTGVSQAEVSTQSNHLQNTSKLKQEVKPLVEPVLQAEIQRERHKNKKEILFNSSSNEAAVKPTIPQVETEHYQSSIYCGTNEDIIDLDDLPSVFYDPSNYMLSTLLMSMNEAKQTSQVLSFSVDGIVIVIDCPLNTIYCSEPLTSHSYINLCCSVDSHHKIKENTLNYDEIRVNRILRAKHQKLAHPIEMFIATTSLLTAQGRLPEYIDITKRIALVDDVDKHYFDLIPNSAEIMQYIRADSMPLLEIARINAIPQRYVFSFYNIAFNLNLLAKADEPTLLNKTIPKSLFKGLFKK